MSRNILFISEQKLKDSSMLSDNIDPKQLLPTVKVVQDVYVMKICGTALYNKLGDDIAAGTVAGPYKELLDMYLTDVLVWYVLAEMPMPLQFKMLNKGVLERTNEQTSQVSYGDVRSMMKWCADKAEWYAQRAIDHLKQNRNSFPEYMMPGSGIDTVHPGDTQYETGLFLVTGYMPDRRSFEEKYQGNNYRKP